jgi:predicted PhzF superfamily epimerase YddE/YHI9
VRAFFPGNNGLCEDPVTGSLNAALAQWLIGAGLAPERYVAAQGTALARVKAACSSNATPTARSGSAAQR